MVEISRGVRESVSVGPTPAALGFRMPAEWEPHAATWLTWPTSDDWPGKLEAVRWVFCELVRQLQRTERVRLLIRSAQAQAEIVRQLRAAHVELERVDFVSASTDRSWARDNLPQFVVNQARELAAVKFQFNGWARYPDHEQDERAGVLVAERAAQRRFFPAVERQGVWQRFVLEGGAIDVDGAGTLLTTRRCLLGSPFQRNPGISQEQVEAVLEEQLNATQVIWLEDGIAGDDTSGHIDDFARFARAGTILLAQQNDGSDADHRPLERAREQLECAQDARGRRLELVRLPMPTPLYFDGERLPASYANFYLANELVLVPTFNDDQDRVALGILAEVFAGRRVVGVSCVDLVLGLGTIHCSTQQEPVSKDGRLLRNLP